MTSEMFNLLLATIGAPAVVGGVAATANLLVKRQTPRIGRQIRKGEADVRAAEQQWLQKQPTRQPDPVRVGA
jgi:hypothetical protein